MSKNDKNSVFILNIILKPSKTFKNLQNHSKSFKTIEKAEGIAKLRHKMTFINL